MSHRGFRIGDNPNVRMAFAHFARIEAIEGFFPPDESILEFSWHCYDQTCLHLNKMGHP